MGTGPLLFHLLTVSPLWNPLFPKGCGVLPAPICPLDTSWTDEFLCHSRKVSIWSLSLNVSSKFLSHHSPPTSVTKLLSITSGPSEKPQEPLQILPALSRECMQPMPYAGSSMTCLPAVNLQQLVPGFRATLATPLGTATQAPTPP